MLRKIFKILDANLCRYGIIFLFIVGLLSPITGNAKEILRHVVIVPSCLVHHLRITPQILAKHNSFFMLNASDSTINELMLAKKHNKDKLCGGFIDVTEEFTAYTKSNHIDEGAINFLKKFIETPEISLQKTYDIKYEKEVNALLSQINPQLMWDNLSYLSSYRDRYANSNHGIEAANWIKTQIEKLAKENNHKDVTVYTIATGTRYQQPSVVAKMGEGNEPGIVLSGHMDTLSSLRSIKPGADDDGSGSVTVIELARTLFSSGMHFKKPIYFMWYAAEEEGLVGSGYVVSAFKKKNIPIDAVLHFDMTGFAYHNENAMWLITDYVNKNLMQFLEKLITTYVKQPVKYTRCGYACSDHASWTKNGYPAAMAAEAAFEHTNPVLHTAQDTIDKLSLSHMSDYLKLGIAFAVELAEPTQ